jgi:hypothetical protein
MAKKGKQLATAKDLENLYASEAAIAAKAAPQGEGVPRISTADTQFKVGETDLPDPLQVIVVADALQNIYYDTDYDPSVKHPPACFAVGEAVEGGDALLHAHPTSPNIQGGANDHDCATCEMNRYGTAERGKGKACANTRQLAVVMADDPALEGPGELKWAQLQISPAGLPAWGKFVSGLANIVKRPPWGVVTQFTFDKKNPIESRRKTVVAISYKPIANSVVGRKVMALRKQILETKALLRPIPVGDYEAPKPKKAPPARKTAKRK